MPTSDDVVLVEAEQDIRELERHIADQHILIKNIDASGSDDDQAKAREGLFLLEDALEIARRRLRTERKARGMES
jgi:hypothetical protein